MKKFWATVKLVYPNGLIKMTMIVSLIASSLVACTAYGKYNGVTFIASPGNPPAESIIWSPVDINQVLVAASASNHDNDQLLILNTKTSEKTILQENNNGKLFGLDWSPDGNHILFGSTSGFVGNKGNTLIISTDGNNETTNLFEWVPDAAWSPDGITIAYFSYGQPTGTNLQEIKLHLMDIRNREDTVLATFESQNTLGLSWSPNGEKLVFALGSLKSSNLFILELGEREAIQITKDGLADSPVWSPKGDLIAYHKFSKDGVVSSLAVIRADGSCDIQIPDLDYVWSPAWLPDGKTLGFLALDGIYTLDLESIFTNNIYEADCPKPLPDYSPLGDGL